jgi:hypothetical protein
MDDTLILVFSALLTFFIGVPLASRRQRMLREQRGTRKLKLYQVIVFIVLSLGLLSILVTLFYLYR